MTWTLSAWGAEVALADRCRVGSLDDVIGSEQQRLRDGETDLLGRLEIDDELELRRLLDRNIAGLGTFQNLVHIHGGAPVQVGNVHSVKHKPPDFHKIVLVVHDREPVLYRKFHNLRSLRTEDRAV